MKISRIHPLFASAFLLLILASCSMDPVEPEPMIDPEPDPEPQTEIWSGDVITFEKRDDTDPLQASNQDRITDKVWITRGAGGQIFNAVTESVATKETSPAGTQWALGTTSGIDTLRFGLFRDIVGNPQNIVGEELVLKLVEEQILIDVTFTKWSSGQKGGFAYERSTK